MSKLQLVDLAGSEKLNANEESHAETKNINKSLLHLSRVIEALARYVVGGLRAGKV